MMMSLQRSEFDDQTDEEYKAEVYRQLEWLRISRKYKPGWTFFMYQEVFKEKPGNWVEKLEPREPTKAMLLWLNRRNAAFKRGKERERTTKDQGL